MVYRNKLFIKFPGRDIGGALALFLPFKPHTWLALAGFTFTVPFFLFICYKVLKFFNLCEDVSYGYGLNVFVLFNAFSQQVQTITNT